MATHINHGNIGWIRYKDRKPELGQWCLVFVTRGTWYASDHRTPDEEYVVGDHCVCSGKYQGDHWDEFGPDRYHKDEVEYWAPINIPVERA